MTSWWLARVENGDESTPDGRGEGISDFRTFSKNVHPIHGITLYIDLAMKNLAPAWHDVGRNTQLDLTVHVSHHHTMDGGRRQASTEAASVTIFPSFNMMMITWTLLCLFSFMVTVRGECFPALCDHGDCVGDECQCYPNFAGADCSIPFETCEDGERTCYNGSTCVRNNSRDPTTNKYKYHCDCTKAEGESPFAGLQCREQATTYCVVGREKSEYAFCANGGECIRLVENGKAHPGCKCSEEFEGQHCQYLKGEAPAEDLGQPYMLVPGEGGDSAKGIVIFVIIVVCASVILAMAYVVHRKRTGKSNEATTAPSVTTVNHDESEVI